MLVVYNRSIGFCNNIKQVITEEGFSNPWISSNTPMRPITFKNYLGQIKIAITDEYSGYWIFVIVNAQKIGSIIGQIKDIVISYGLIWLTSVMSPIKMINCRSFTNLLNITFIYITLFFFE